MIHPSPTTPIAPTQARGMLIEMVPATEDAPAQITLTFANTSYELHLEPTAEIVTPVGKRVVGTIHVRARRVDAIGGGGRYIEPVIGRPRRVQGTIVAADGDTNELCVNAGVPIWCKLTDPRQSTSQFEVGQLVTMDVHEGATFTPEA